MANFSTIQIRDLMEKPNNIRNVSLIANSHHGKTTLAAHLKSKLGNIKNNFEFERNMSSRIKSPGVFLFYDHDTSQTGSKQPYLINLLGYEDSSLEVLRVTDGALLIVDIVEGVLMQTERVLRWALQEKIRPVLMINKIDKFILQFPKESESIYQNLISIIKKTNMIISSYEQPAMGDFKFYPSKGNVAFGSGIEGWGFTLTKFARIYEKKFKIDIEKMTEKLWGNNYYDPEAKKWKKENFDSKGKPLKRAFCVFIIEPIIKLTQAVMEGEKGNYMKICESIGVQLNETKEKLEGKYLLQYIMEKWINISDTLMEMMVIHLPSPKIAQNYRYSDLYEGPLDDECAKGIKNCDPKGPLIMYVSKMVLNGKSSFIAFGRVFSGTISVGQKVRIMGTNYMSGTKEDINEKKINSIVLMNNETLENITDVPCGNIVGLMGIDRYIFRSGTLSDHPDAHVIRNLKSSERPVLQVEVSPKKPVDLPKFIEGIMLLAKSDSRIQFINDDTSKLIIAGTDEFHLASSFQFLQKQLFDIEFLKSDYFLAYRETISQKSSQTCMAKSPNKQNRLYCVAEPLENDLSILIENGIIGPNDNPKLREDKLVKDFGWSHQDALKIWAFGPENSGPNILVEATKPIKKLEEIRGALDSAFQWCTKEGVLCEEPTRQIKINLLDAELYSTRYSEAINRNFGQLLPTARRVYYASQLTAIPKLQEPIYLYEIIVPFDVTNALYQCINERRGVIIEERQINGGDFLVKAHLPVAESFGSFFYKSS